MTSSGRLCQEIGCSHASEHEGRCLTWKCLCAPRRRKDADQRQVPRGLHRPPAAGAGEGVPLQQVYHDQEEGGARHSTQPIGETGTPAHSES